MLAILFNVNGEVFYFTPGSEVSRENEFGHSNFDSYQILNGTNGSITLNIGNIEGCSTSLPSDGGQVIFPVGGGVGVTISCGSGVSLSFGFDLIESNTMTWLSDLQVIFDVSTFTPIPKYIATTMAVEYRGCISSGGNKSYDTCKFGLVLASNENNILTFTLHDTYE